MKQRILLLLLLSILFTITTKANETEPNDTKAQANTLALNGSQTGAIGTGADVDWYKVTTNADGKLSITLNISNGLGLWCALYDNDGATQLAANYTFSNATVINADGLAAGTYYLKLYPYFDGQMPEYTVSNTLTVATPANDAEPNNIKTQAKLLPLNGSKTGHVNFYYNNQRDSADWYKVTTNKDGRLRLRFTAGNGQNVWAYLFDKDGTTVLKSGYTSTSTDINADGLAAGVYYVRVNSYYSYPSHTYNGGDFETYTLEDSLFVPNEENDNEPNDSVQIANTLALNSSTTGHLNYYYNHVRDVNDWYKITVNKDGKLRLRITSGNGQNFWAYLFDQDGTTVLNSGFTSGTRDINSDGLAAGVYYVRVNSYYSYPSNIYNGTDFETYTLEDSLFVPSEANDDEPNDSMPIAQTLALNSTTTGHTNYYYDHQRDANDWYKITLNKDGMLRLRLTSGNSQNLSAYLFDHDGTSVLNSGFTPGTIDIVTDGMAAGTYYVRINSYYSYGSNVYNGTDFEPYTLQDSLFTYANAADEEPNDYFSDAPTLPANKTSTGHVGFYYNGVRDNVDFYKINFTANNGKLTLTFNQDNLLKSGGIRPTWFQVYKDTTAGPIFSQYYITNSSGDINLTSLTKGYYYIKVTPYYSGIGTEFSSYSITNKFAQTKAIISTFAYDSSFSCNDNSITYKMARNNPPYTVQLYRFQQKYRAAKITNKIKLTFNNLPDGIYYATVYGDGATGAAKSYSDTISIMPSPSNTKARFIKGRQVTLMWDTLPCADYFTIRYKAKDSSQWHSIKTDGNVSSYVLTGLALSTTYQWQMSASDKENGLEAKSKLSPLRKFTTKDGSGSGSFAAVDDNEENMVDNNIHQSILVVAPNPAVSYFTIRLNTAVKDRITATLYNVNGKSVWTSGASTVDALNGKQVMVNQFGSGLYYLKITGVNGDFIAGAKLSVNK